MPMAFANRTPEQIAAALEKAREARAANKELLNAVKSGEVTLADILSDDYLDNARAQRLQVSTLLRHVPGVGVRRAEALMTELKIAENRRVGGLGVRQRKALTEKLAK